MTQNKTFPSRHLLLFLSANIGAERVAFLPRVRDITRFNLGTKPRFLEGEFYSIPTGKYWNISPVHAKILPFRILPTFCGVPPKRLNI
jgi:hypothetical protein